MKILDDEKYFVALSGEPVKLDGIGHFRSPKLREIARNNYEEYNMHLSLLLTNMSELVSLMGGGKYGKLFQKDKIKSDLEKLDLFDFIGLIPNIRDMYCDSISFFIVENLTWDDSNKKFVVKDDKGEVCGEITKLNYKAVCELISQLNWVQRQDEEKSNSTNAQKFSSEKAKSKWEEAQEFLKKQSQISVKHKKHNDPDYSIGNIISKLSIASPNYNLINIWDLTVFQLYDQFYQYSYDRQFRISEAAFSHWGGKKFDERNWIKSIKKQKEK